MARLPAQHSMSDHFSTFSGDPQLVAARRALLDHPLYERVSGPVAVARFMEVHVFAVWDFMSLLKRLQRDLTCVATPWFPAKQRSLARFINEIVLGEESDDDGCGGHISHFELYREAMGEMGAEDHELVALLSRLGEGVPHNMALKQVPLDPAIREFVGYNLDLATDAEPHRVAAAFFFGREDIIPEMFARLLDGFERQGAGRERFEYYVRRHIELDGDHHGPLSRQLLEVVCGDDRHKWSEAVQTAIESLELRAGLWDLALRRIESA